MKRKEESVCVFSANFDFCVFDFTTSIVEDKAWIEGQSNAEFNTKYLEHSMPKVKQMAAIKVEIDAHIKNKEKLRRQLQAERGDKKNNDLVLYEMYRMITDLQMQVHQLVDRILVDRVVLPYTDPIFCTGADNRFDNNVVFKGLIHFIGTKGFTNTYFNPGKDIVTSLGNSVSTTQPKSIVVNVSRGTGKDATVVSNDASATTVLNTANDYYGSSNIPSSWWGVDLGENRSMIVDHYSLRQYVGSFMLCNWSLQGSNDGKRWIDLQRHDNDNSLIEGHRNGCHSWPVETLVHGMPPTGFRYFRILQHGKNAGDGNSISDVLYCLMGFELYGCLALTTHRCRF